MATRQNALIVTTRITRDPDGLVDVLRKIDSTVQRPPFRNLCGTHFFRWAVLREAQCGEGRPYGPTLLLSTIYDGSSRAHFKELARELTAEFRKVYSYCGDVSHWTPEHIVRFLRANGQGPGLFFNGALFRTQQQIQLEQQTGWTWIQDELDELNRLGNPSRETLTYLRKKMLGVERLAEWRRRPSYPSKPRLLTEALLILAILTLGLHWFLWFSGNPPSVLESIRVTLGWILTLILWPLVGLGIIHAVLFRLVQKQEEIELETPPASSCVPSRKTMPFAPPFREAGSEQNEVTHIALIKPGWIRRRTLRVILFWLNLVARLHYARRLHLGRITTIHFAHWTVLYDPPERARLAESRLPYFWCRLLNKVRRGRPTRLAFIAHYDGTFDSYLEDFTLLDTHFGVNAIWSNCIGFPVTHGVFRGGAREQLKTFIEFGRKYQHATNVWYSAYPTITAEHINRNTAVRRGLHGRRLFGWRLPDSSAEDWTTLKRMT